ncbi:predicted protein [Phaeodactylum tricornutum CCAP 1055/1]|uniref:SET domain-containing protein n=1 Tax=Phaeodactylum tricornutum (strain CCAP 1055/1) TaxID=556484 RepID=B7G7D4_PHATC|nr:predicted protein [Phaeodactylum tricornutum CCAP 1055/1]EEC45473.1 predicted protein [Phaeodactylum tricornutum CCAP 1055/1]|eukprot:XP_002183255.1 predicted protein [Phaeodactylum tricornutum CCAP 1055/1]
MIKRKLGAVFATAMLHSRLTTALAVQHSALADVGTDAFGGKGLFAKQDIQAGLSVLDISRADIIYGCEPHSYLADVTVRRLSPDDDNESQRGFWSIAAALVCSRLLEVPVASKLGVGPSVISYISQLPWDDCMWQLPIVWSESVLDQALIYGTEMALAEDLHATHESSADVFDTCLKAKRRVLNLKQIGTELAEVLLPILHQNGCLHSDDVIMLTCHQAVALVFSRTHQKGSAGKLALLPFFDCANHMDDSNCRLSESEGDDRLHMVAERNIKKGEELTISYGIAYALAAFCSYGFVPDPLIRGDLAGKAIQYAARKGQSLAADRSLNPGKD